MAQRARQARRSRPCSAVTSMSSKKMRPSLGSFSRLIMRSRVDLPEPDWPMTPTSWPLGTTREMLSTARLSPNFFTTPSSRSMPLLRNAPR